jgi:MOSC domain-containing protein YiiM
MTAIVHQINVKPKTRVERGLPKVHVESAFVSRKGIRGDFNVYRHEVLKDDPDSALLVIPLETIEELNLEGWPVKPGDLGENITTRGVSYSSFSIGKTYAIRGVSFQISRACDPCDNLYLLPYVGKSKGPRFLKTMLGRRGWYARVLEEGWVAKGDPIIEGAGP